MPTECSAKVMGFAPVDGRRISAGSHHVERRRPHSVPPTWEPFMKMTWR
jgi:hypothetical protein